MLVTFTVGIVFIHLGKKSKLVSHKNFSGFVMPSEDTRY